MKAIRRTLVVAVLLLGGVLCPPAWAETTPAELEATDDCGTCVDWIGCGCCAVRAVVAVPDMAAVSLVQATLPSARVDAPAPPSIVEVFHPPRP